MMDVYEEHLSEAGFLWTRWERCLASPTVDLTAAEAQEERLLAHMDGLAFGGPEVAERLLILTLELEAPAEVASAAFALLASGQDGAKHVLERLEVGEGPALAGIQRALELDDSLAAAALLPLLSSSSVDAQAVVLEALVFRRAVPPSTLARFLSHADPRLQATALLGLEGHPEESVRKALHAALDAPQVHVRNAALVSGLIAGLRRAWDKCEKWAAEPSAVGAQARVLLALGGSEQDVTRLVKLLDVPELRSSTLWALSFSGQLAAAEACLAWMEEDRGTAALAAEAFSAITGLPLEGAYVGPSREDEAEEPIPLEEEDLDADLVPGPEDALATPAPDAVAAWWKEARARFDPGTRYLRGIPFSAQSLLGALHQEPMRRRGVLALELAIRSRGQFRLEARAFTRRQASELARALAAPASISPRRFDGLMTQG
ncbi:TIGR02270 family protein [Archangium violaceum]|uniref:TIGR02270 family protein n=1 Tax=Archangium violaceum TaxID=83451 RepID=UPI00193C1A19|nr:TIGR02270 family protein [Archangium violaceum]QRK07176.1 TIGR02270 family protein [Archangium violaceum]